jgi:hypothetical protein
MPYATIRNFYDIDEDKGEVQNDNKKVEMTFENVKGLPLTDPSVFGPPLWFTLHNGTNKYPEHASKITIERMKGFILGIPYILPCENCMEHARAYITSKYSELDDICSGKQKLFRFFVDMHNYVNKRYGKPVLSYDDAEIIYNKPAIVKKMSYKMV